MEFVKNSLPRHSHFEGLRIVVDCANGAAYKAAPLVLKELGATVIPLAISPNGQNINDKCGATAPQMMCEAVRQEKAHVGIAFDGDADRVVFADEKGTVVDGDQIMALMAADWQERGLLQGKGIVATHMSNLGLERYLNQRGLDLVRTPIGDRYVAEAMRDTGCNLGGESSGHVILSDYATSGDGLLTALQVLLVLKLKQQPASQVLTVFKSMPQILRNVKLSPTLLESPEAQEVMNIARKSLENKGRLLVRPSGTEPLIRIMAEAEDEKFASQIVDSIAVTLANLSKKEVA
jgi:phosphoglucosamine mutase